MSGFNYTYYVAHHANAPPLDCRGETIDEIIALLGQEPYVDQNYPGDLLKVRINLVDLRLINLLSSDWPRDQRPAWECGLKGRVWHVKPVCPIYKLLIEGE